MSKCVSEVMVENWNGCKIRFVKQNGEWFALLNDLSVIFSSSINFLMHSLDGDMITRINIDQYNVLARDMDLLNDDMFKKACVYGHEEVYSMLAVNEIGLYKILLENNEAIESRKLRRWTTGVLQKLRKQAGLEPYEALRMCDESVQARIDDILDSLYYDEELGCIMQSVTVAGGDVEQVVYCEDISGV